MVADDPDCASKDGHAYGFLPCLVGGVFRPVLCVSKWPLCLAEVPMFFAPTDMSPISALCSSCVTHGVDASMGTGHAHLPRLQPGEITTDRRYRPTDATDRPTVLVIIFALLFVTWGKIKRKIFTTSFLLDSVLSRRGFIESNCATATLRACVCVCACLAALTPSRYRCR